MTTAKLRFAASALLACLFAALPSSAQVKDAKERHYLYVAEPGIRNYEEFGGVGLLVFDIDAGYKFVKRIPTWTVPAGEKPVNVKGIAASAATGRIYISNLNRVVALDILSGK